jgi:hypothetical protein
MTCGLKLKKKQITMTLKFAVRITHTNNVYLSTVIPPAAKNVLKEQQHEILEFFLNQPFKKKKKLIIPRDV